LHPVVCVCKITDSQNRSRCPLWIRAPRKCGARIHSGHHLIGEISAVACALPAELRVLRRTSLRINSKAVPRYLVFRLSGLCIHFNHSVSTPRLDVDRTQQGPKSIAEREERYRLSRIRNPIKVQHIPAPRLSTQVMPVGEQASILKQYVCTSPFDSGVWSYLDD
jgi:hypothetical protein